MNSAVAAEAIIIKNNQALIIKRRPNDVHNPGTWDIPGGRLEPGEDPAQGVKREAKEEVNLDIEIILPIDVQHFTRQDGQVITMIIYLCRPVSEEVKLSEEHTEYKWVNLDNLDDSFPKWIVPVLKNIKKFHLDNYL